MKSLILFLMISTAHAEVGIPVEEPSISYNVYCLNDDGEDKHAASFNTREEAEDYISYDSRQCHIQEE